MVKKSVIEDGRRGKSSNNKRQVYWIRELCKQEKQKNLDVQIEQKNLNALLAKKQKTIDFSGVA